MSSHFVYFPQEREEQTKVRAELRKELQESSLALSEMRSLLSASQRQEKATTQRLETDIRELKQKLFLSEVRMPDAVKSCLV